MSPHGIMRELLKKCKYIVRIPKKKREEKEIDSKALSTKEDILKNILEGKYS